jgi:hypothetical protein
MDDKTRQRAIRTFLGSLLQSGLSTSEIQEIAEELYFGSFGRELGEFIRNAMDTIDDADRDKPKALPDEPSIKKKLNEVISRRRLAKKAVVQLMTLAAPKIRPNAYSATSSMSDLLEKFIATATPTEVSSFFSILQGEPADAYLKGIARRSREK